MNLDDVALAFRDLNIQLPDLEEYIVNVDPVPCAVHAPKFPIPKESNLNFLKPGSKEVVTRPVHIHEHLPAINPLDGDDDDAEKCKFPNGISSAFSLLVYSFWFYLHFQTNDKTVLKRMEHRHCPHYLTLKLNQTKLM